jgi:hypothetical protein
VKAHGKQCFHPSFLRDLFFDLEDGSDFFQNTDWLSLEYMALYSGK